MKEIFQSEDNAIRRTHLRLRELLLGVDRIGAKQTNIGNERKSKKKNKLFACLSGYSACSPEIRLMANSEANFPLSDTLGTSEKVEGMKRKVTVPLIIWTAYPRYRNNPLARIGGKR